MTAADIVAGPLKTFLRQYAAILSLPPAGRTVWRLAAGIAIGWWLYVPVHELLHAAGCLISGGQVTRLEIRPIYGGALLARAVPFVTAGGDYAGRLSGFDTGGSDWTYFVTVYFPYLLSLGGFWLMEAAVRRRSVFLFGAAIPCALAPLVSLTGDFLEAGALLLYQVWPGPDKINRHLISDDLFRLLEQVGSGYGGLVMDASRMWFIGAALAVGACMAWGTLVAADRIRAAASTPGG